MPTPNVSVVDLKFVAKRATSKDEINDAIKATADGNGPLKGILGYTEQPNVSTDFNHDSRSSIFHLDQTKVIDGSSCACYPGTTTNGVSRTAWRTLRSPWPS